MANVVLACHQFPYGTDIPTSDFWNLAGRAGRVEQGEVGLIAPAATDEERARKLRNFVSRQVAELNSTLIDMVDGAMAGTTRSSPRRSSRSCAAPSASRAFAG